MRIKTIKSVRLKDKNDVVLSPENDMDCFTIGLIQHKVGQSSLVHSKNTREITSFTFAEKVLLEALICHE